MQTQWAMTRNQEYAKFCNGKRAGRFETQRYLKNVQRRDNILGTRAQLWSEDFSPESLGIRKKSIYHKPPVVLVL